MNYMLMGGLLVLLARTQASLASNSSTSWSNTTDHSPNNSDSSYSCELYTVKSGDTCFSISLNTNISYAQVMAWNPQINLACTNLANLTRICISNPSGNFTLPSNTGDSGGFTTAAPIPSPTVGGSSTDCGEWHKVISGDDCGTIATAYGITPDQFHFLNPEVNTNCTNLWLNYYYCVEPVGSISTYSGYQSTATTTRTTRSINQTLTTPMPYVANIWENYTSSLPTIPLANGTRIDCTEYTWFSNDIFVSNSAITDCWTLAWVYGISREDFILWNPSLAQGPAADGSIDSTSLSEISSIASSIASAVAYGGASTTSTMTTATKSGNITLYNVTVTEQYAYSCTVAPSSSYCLAIAPAANKTTTATISTPSPIALGEASNCTAWFAPESFDTCQGILDLFGLTIAELYAMNPSVGSDCTGMAVGTYYCVSWYPNGLEPSVPDDSGTGTISTPSPIQTDMVSSCDEFYKVVSGDSCNAIAGKYNITTAEFHTWNPAVGSSCTMLIIGDYVCVGVLPSNTTTTTTASTQTGVVTPSPIQTGMVSNCDKFYQVKSGDACPSVASKFGISMTDLHAWNPAIGSSCTMLIIGDYTCVGIASHTTPITTTHLHV